MHKVAGYRNRVSKGFEFFAQQNPVPDETVTWDELAIALEPPDEPYQEGEMIILIGNDIEASILKVQRGFKYIR